MQVKWQFQGNLTLQGRNPQFEREHSPDLQAGLPEETKTGKKERNEAAGVLSIPHDTRGWPPALRELDGKLISLLQSIRSRGGIVNFCFVKATALAVALIIVIHLQICQDLRLRHPGLGLFISGAIPHAEREPLPARQYHLGFLKNATLLI